MYHIQGDWEQIGKMNWGLFSLCADRVNKVITYHTITACCCKYNIMLNFCLLGKGGYIFSSIGLCFCLSVCEQHYSKTVEQIVMKFYEGAQGVQWRTD